MRGLPRLSHRGLGLLSVGVGLLILGVASRQRDVIWPAAFLILLPVSAALVLLFSTRNLHSARTVLPDQVQAGEPVVVHLNLGHTGIGIGGVHVVEERAPESLGATPAFLVPSGWGRTDLVHRYELRPPLRGRYQLGGVAWRSADALGLAVHRAEQGTLTPLTVTPRVVPLGAVQHASGAGLAGDSAVLRSSLIGPDDALIREYRPRDDVRRIHWPSTARMGTMMVRREERSWDPSAIILLDSRAVAHSGDGLESTFEWAVSAAASIGIHLLDAGFEVDLVEADGRQLEQIGQETIRKRVLLQHLTDSSLTQATSLDGAVETLRRRTRAQLLIAILGQLAHADAIALGQAHRDRRLG
ncbi:MAG: DUF58 domain-containing protein, partial [Micropruina sp.]